jgi:hypothetical protein
MMRRTFAALFACLAFAAFAAAAPQTPQQPARTPTQGQTMCAEIQKSINELAPFAQTSCQSGGGSTSESTSFLTISLSPLWDNADAKRAWLEAVVEAAGITLNANPTAKVDEIIVADVGQLSARVAWALPAQLVKDLQAGVKAGRIKQDEVYPQIEKGLIRKPINAR